MKRGGTFGGALGVVALATMFLLRGPGAGPGAQSGEASAPAKTPAVAGGKAKARPSNVTVLPEAGPWRASRDHYSGFSKLPACQTAERSGTEKKLKVDAAPSYPLMKDLELQQGDDAPLKIERPRSTLWKIPDCEKVQAMIAIVPDPVHTHLALLFDRSLEAIQLGAESGNYLVDRFWLPWRTETPGGWSNYESYKDAERDEGTRLQQPGLLIFRYNGEVASEGALDSSAGSKSGSPGLLYIFLVADTPTSGVNGSQFSRAVDYVKQICDSPWGCPTLAPPSESKNAGRRIQIMGPMFSGSLASLRQITSDAGAIFTAYSGTVSSICAIQEQHLGIGSTGLCNKTIAKTDLTSWLQFRTMVSASELSVNRFIGMLRTSGEIKCDQGNPEVAVLAEAATTYGAAQRRQIHVPPKQNQSRPESVPDGEFEDASSEAVEDVKNCSAGFSYPREISNLRNAYHAAGAAAEPGKTGTAAGPYLSFTLADRQNNSDEPQDYSGQQGPLSKEAVLMKMAAELRDRKYKYIGIIGTNVLDVLFLSNFLRSAYPNARLFVIGADLLFERDLDNASLIGTLAVTTYPLIDRNLEWSSLPRSTQPDRLPFSDQYEEGEFNATIRLLHNIIPGNLPVAHEIARPFGDPSLNRPIWLTVVGTSGYWPVRMLDAKAEAGAAPLLEKKDFSLAWKIITVLLCALAFLHVLVALKVSPVAPRLRDFSVLAPQAKQRMFFIHVASAILALTIGMIAMPAWRFGGWQCNSVGLLAVVAVLTIVLLIATCCRLDYGCLKRGTIGRGAWLIHALVWGFGFWLGLKWACLFQHDASLYGFFFSYRAVHMATGVSPMTPMIPLLAAGYAWSLYEIWRLRFNDDFRPRLKSAKPAPAALLAGNDYEQPLADALRKYWLSPKYAIAFLLAFALWLLFLDPRQPFRLFELSGFGLVYELLLSAVVLMLLSSGFRFGQAWAVLHRLLSEMERGRVRFMFRRLKHSDWSPIWRPGGEEPQWINTARSIELLEEMKEVEGCNGPEASLSPLARAVNAATACYNRVTDLHRNLRNRTLEQGQTVQSGYGRFVKDYKEMEGALSEALNEVLEVLPQRWKSLGCLPVEDSPSPKDAEMKDAVSSVIRDVLHGAAEDTADPSRQEKQCQKAQVARMEAFVAWRYEGFIRAGMYQLRQLLFYLAISFSLILVSLNLYSFEPHQSLIWSLTVIFFVLGMLTIIGLMQIHRDPILSRMSGTQPNDLGLDFYVRIVSLGAAPLITLLATHFPSIGRGLLSFLQPGLEALK